MYSNNKFELGCYYVLLLISINGNYEAHWEKLLTSNKLELRHGIMNGFELKKLLVGMEWSWRFMLIVFVVLPQLIKLVKGKSKPRAGLSQL